MKTLILAAFAALLVSCGSGSSASSVGSNIIDHASPSADTIPQGVLTAVRGMDTYFEHASVGSNITGGLPRSRRPMRFATQLSGNPMHPIP